MTDFYKVQPISGPVSGEVTPPGSKSITNRALLIASLADGPSLLRGVLDSEDTRAMTQALRALGVSIEATGEKNLLRVVGNRSFPNRCAEVFAANSGTTARFLTAALAFAQGRYRLDGKERMRQRPMRDLVDALRQLGGRIESSTSDDRLPLSFLPAQELVDFQEEKTVSIPGTTSSQFISALMMALPMLNRSVRVEITGKTVSFPYIEMTAKMMAAFGCSIRYSPTEFIHRSGVFYQGRDYTIEPDASAASYFFAIPAVLGGSVRICGLTEESLQGDFGFVHALEQMGCQIQREDQAVVLSRSRECSLRGIDIDMNAISDTAQTLSVVALFADSPTRIRNIAHARLKETDRVAAVVTQLRRLGAEVEEFDDGLLIHPTPEKYRPAQIQTYDDHRMAMSFSIAGLKIPGIEIENPRCVEKTFPDFFEQLEKFCSK